MQRYEFKTKPVANPDAVVGGGQLPYRFTVLTAGLIRYEYAEDHLFEDRASTFAIFREQDVPSFRVIDKENQLEIITEYYHLYYDKKPFSSNGLRVEIKGGITASSSTWRYGYKHEGAIYELGGTARTLDGANGRIPLGPGVIARNGYAEIDDSESMLFTEDGWIAGRRPPNDHGAMDTRPNKRSKSSDEFSDRPRIDGYLFAYGFDYIGAIKAFYAVSGPQPLLPRWALGNWWSRYYKYSDDSYLELMDRFRDEKIPFSVGVLDMDWHWVDNEKVRRAGVSGWTGYSWDTDLFPEPKKFLEELHARKLKVPVCDHPADGIASYEDKYEAVCRAVGQDPTTKDPVPFNITDKKYVDAYFDIVLRKLEDDGVDFFWQDWQQGPFSSIPGIDPLWPLNHFHFLNSSRGGKRPFIFSRFPGPGGHRYPVGFSGDSVVSWQSLSFQPEFTADASNIGFGWWSNDIGGHMQGYRDDELATRWVQLGTFSPILRLHSTANPWMSKEPWNYPVEACTAQDAALRLRHRLIPYLYSMNVFGAHISMPLIRPTYWSHPGRNEAYAHRNTFHFGEQLFVVPMTSPCNRVTQRSQASAWLPPGRHVDIFSGTVYDGDREYLLHRTLSEFAVFAPEGSIVSLDGATTPGFGADNPTSIELLVVVGKDGVFRLLEDDGSGIDLDTAPIACTYIEYIHRTGTLKIQPPPANNCRGLPNKRAWKITFLAIDTSQPSGAGVCIDVDVGGNKSPTHTVTENKHTRSTQVSIPAVSTQSYISIGLISPCQDPDLNRKAAKISSPAPEPPKLLSNDTNALTHTIINALQIAYDVKKSLWTAVSGEGVQKNGLVTADAENAGGEWSLGRALAGVNTICAREGLDPGVEQALVEVLTADERSFPRVAE